MTTETIPKNGTETADREQTRRGQYYRPNVDLMEKTDELLVVVDVPARSATRSRSNSKTVR